MMTIILFCLGAAMGSFLTLVSIRVIERKDWVNGRSLCDHCGKTLGFFDLIPIISFIGTGGRSRCCGKKLSLLYPFSELFVGFAFAVIGQQYFSMLSLRGTIEGVLILVCISLFWIIFVSDIRFEIIPVDILTAAFVVGAIYVALHVPSCTFATPLPCIQSFLPNVLSGLIPGILFFCLWFFSRGKAMGDGDISLVFALGFLIGYPSIIVALYIAFLTGAIVGVILILQRKKTVKSHISFGPFLIAGAGMAAVWGTSIVQFVTRLWF